MLQAKRLEDKLLKQRREAEEKDAKRRAEKQNLPYLDLISNKAPTELEAMELVPETEAQKTLLTPLKRAGRKLTLAIFDAERPDTKAILETLKKKYTLNIFIVSLSGLKHAWQHYQYLANSKKITGKVEIDEENLNKIVESVRGLAELASTIKSFKSPFTSKVLEIILGGALALEASDLHFEPKEKTSTLRLRIDGILHTIYEELAPPLYQSLVSRIKLLSRLKLNIHDQPQDGRFSIALKSRSIEIRTSVIPSESGETIVLRILDPKSLKINLEELGWRPDDLNIIQEEIKKPNGLILNTGPTGSGKTTTLYGFLRKISNPKIKIITIEDPIEYHLPGVSQTQIDSSAGYTFATGLRSVLRQDPDVILVGEIRDKETAEIALNASLTGHLVLSTLHTNDAIGAIPRLIDLGAKPQTLGPAVTLVIAQRLVRLLCSKCRKVKKLNGKTTQKIETFIENLPSRIDRKLYQNFKIYEAQGCKTCAEIGYKGRTSVFELFPINENVEEAIYNKPTEIKLRELAKEQGMVEMQTDGILKILLGLTSFEEIERLTGEITWLR